MERARTNPWVVLLVLCAGFFMILLDTTIVNIAIPSMVDGLHASLDQILWVINAYILVYAVLLITAGRLGDLAGTRTLFALGLILFTISSGLCGLAQNTDQLIAARVLQGVGGALLTPQTLAMLTTIFPPERRGAAFGIWGAVGGIAAVAGPTLGGFIVTNWDWRWIFFVNLPIGALTLVATFRFVPELRLGRNQRLDLPGVALASLGLLGITFGLIDGERYHWGIIWGWITIPIIMATGVVVLIGFVFWERAQKEPLMPLELFKNRNFVVTNWISAVISFGTLGMFLPLTIYLQSVLGMTAFAAGLTAAPVSIASMLVAPLSGRLADRFGGKYILMGGLTLFAAGMGAVAVQSVPGASGLTFLPSFIVAGIGMGFVFAPMTTVAMSEIEPRVAGAASGVLNTTRQIGGVIGSAVVGAALQNRLAVGLHDQAVAFSIQLPSTFREQFIAGFSQAAQAGLDVGRTGAGSEQLPPGLPPEVAQQLLHLGREVFAYAFADAMRVTLGVPIALLLLGALSCLAIQRSRTTPASRGVATTSIGSRTP